MPLPLLVPAAMIIGGLFGAGKTAKAIYDNSKANDVASNAKNIVETANRKLDLGKGATNRRLSDYGMQKLEALDSRSLNL